MLFKIISHRRFRALQEEQRKLKDQCVEQETEISRYQQQEGHLDQESQKKDELLEERSASLKQMGQDFHALEEEYRQVQEQNEASMVERIELTIRDLGMSREQIKKLRDDRNELINMYIDKLYSLAKHFARTSKGLQKNRGLFLVLADYRNMEGSNFSEFHYGQEEHLEQNLYRGIDHLPHLFSTKISEVLAYMGEKTIIKDKSGKITGHEERDGSLLINLQGVAFRSCMMVEGVRTFRVYDKVDQLKKGSSRHNAAIYASSLDEVMASIVVSEEDSEVTLFIDGKFIKRYDPHHGIEITEEQELGTEIKEGKIEALEGEATVWDEEVEVVEEVIGEEDVEIIEEVDDEGDGVVEELEEDKEGELEHDENDALGLEIIEEVDDEDDGVVEELEEDKEDELEHDENDALGLEDKITVEQPQV